MNVDIQGLINQLQSLKQRIDNFVQLVSEAEDEGEETIALYKLQDVFQWYDELNIDLACDGLKQAYLDEEDK